MPLSAISSITSSVSSIVTGASVAPTCTIRPGLAAVKVGEALDRLGAVEGEDRVEVGAQRAVAGRLLPALALVGAEVLDLERPAVRDVEQALARGVDREATEIAGDPAPTELLGHRSRCS